MEKENTTNIPNAELLEAIKEVEEIKKDPNAKSYSSFKEILEEALEEE